MSFQFPSPSRFSPSQSYPSQYQRPYPHLPTSTEYGQPLLYGQPFLYGQPPPYSNGAQDYPVDHRWDIQSGRSPYRYQPYSSSYRSKMVSPLRLPPVGLGTSKHPPPSSNIFSNTSDPFLHSAPIPSQSFDQNHAHTIDPPIVPYSIPVTSPDFNAMAGGLYTADASFASDMGYMAFAGDDNVEVHPSDQWLVNNLVCPLAVFIEQTLIEYTAKRLYCKYWRSTARANCGHCDAIHYDRRSDPTQNIPNYPPENLSWNYIHISSPIAAPPCQSQPHHKRCLARLQQSTVFGAA